MTITDVVDTVQTEWLTRSDMTVSITNLAVASYRTLCSKVPFEELQTTSAAIPTQVGVTDYDLKTLITNPPLAGIVSVKIVYNSTQSRRLKKDEMRNFEALQASRPNQKPVRYARWGTSIVLDPPPDSSAYNMYVNYWAAANIITPLLGSTTLQCPDEWKELLDWETFYRTLTILGRHQEAMALFTPGMMPRQNAPKKVFMTELGIIPRLWNDLLQTFRMREYVDDDFGLKPMIYSGYTYAK